MGKETDRWHVTWFVSEHNHNLFDDKFTAMLPAHRKLNDGDIVQVANMRKVGISTPLIYKTMASQSGGYDKVGYRMKDIYNYFTKQLSLQGSEFRGLMDYLQEMCAKDPFMFYKKTVDEEDRLEHLFWCDGVSQMNYQLFGDVLAFDATYKKKTNTCAPLLCFQG